MRGEGETVRIEKRGMSDRRLKATEDRKRRQREEGLYSWKQGAIGSYCRKNEWGW